MADGSLLLRKIDRKFELGRGIHLSHEEIEQLIRSGAYAALAEAVAREVEQKVGESDGQ